MDNNPSAFVFSSKADTLRALSEYKELNIPRSYSISVSEWENAQESVEKNIQKIFNHSQSLAIRSSCRNEDTLASSSAGAFLSELNVSAGDSAAVSEAINNVIASYGRSDDDDQVLIQSMIENPAVTGVIMTRALADGSQYYVINYDDESGKTDTVTGGANVGKTVYVYRTARSKDFDSPRLASFVGLARRLENICGTDLLDIEFCLDKNNILHLLQVRPICAQKQWPETIPSARVEQVAEFVAAKTGSSPNMFGRRSILGVMPDWNPAEMIGVLPRPLATSLYRNLITSRAWAEARERMGYRPIASTELMPLIFGRPYIDVRASFNSFLPKGLEEITCEALVEAWLERLEINPQFHDKIEFEVAQTALDFTFEKDLEDRYPGLLSSSRKRDFREALRNLTSSCLNPDGSLAEALDAISELRGRQAARIAPDPDNRGSFNDIAPLLAECREYGSIPFSILARHAFIAESLLRSATKRDALSTERLSEFKRSIRTISGEMSAEFRSVCEGELNAQTFMRKYGHLRPGSYDILSPRYADRRDIFASGVSLTVRKEPPPFSLTQSEKNSIALLIKESGLETTPDKLLEYAKKAIAGREYGKFIFSRNLSDVLEIIAYGCEDFGFDRDDASFVDIRSFLEWAESAWPESPREYFGRIINYNKDLFARAAGLKLGYLIRSARDVYVAPQHRAAPNFIGSGKASAPVARIDAASSCQQDLAGKIVCVETADPGFDWIFSRGVAGLVTRFGGANSHMAIRCAEYGIPAAIGVGERLYDIIASAETVSLEPAASILKPQC